MNEVELLDLLKLPLIFV